MASDGPTFSPDGQHMWTGAEWIPAPPVSNLNEQNTASLNVQDSVITGDVNITQNIGLNEESIIERMVMELEKFDSNQSGFHIPEGGFNTSVILAGIDEMNQNPNILNNLSTEHLIELCTSLESIGYSTFFQKVAGIVLERGRASRDLTIQAKAHLFLAAAKEAAMEVNEGIIHATESVKLSSQVENVAIESEALFTLHLLLKYARKSTDYLFGRVDELLKDTSILDYSSYAYLLACKGHNLEFTEPIVSEQFEKEAFSYAEKTGDVKLQLLIASSLLENKVHKIELSTLRKLYETCVINNMTFYSLILDFILKAQDDTLIQADRLALLNSMCQKGAEFDVPLLNHLGTMSAMMIDVLESFDRENVRDSLIGILDNPRYLEQVRLSLTSGYLEVVSEFMSTFVGIRIYVNYTNETVRSLFISPREVIPDSEKLLIDLYSLLDRNAPISQIHHMCTILDSDSPEVISVKEDLTGYLSAASADGEHLDSLNRMLEHNQAISSDWSSEVTLLNASVKSEHWVQVLSRSDNLLAQKDEILAARESIWILATAYGAKGLALFNLERYSDSIPVLEETIHWKKVTNEDHSDFERLLQLARSSESQQNVVSQHQTGSQHHAMGQHQVVVQPQNDVNVSAMLRVAWGVLLCIVPFVLLSMTDGMFLWYGLWIYGGFEILAGISKMGR